MSDQATLIPAGAASAHTVTRRTAISSGLAFASVAFASAACPAGSGAHEPPARARTRAQSIDALLIDETIEMPHALPAFIAASGRTLPIVGVRLDAASHPGLMRTMDTSHALVGISSGATLFCLERMAWDHGFRLTGRSERRATAAGEDAWRQDVAAYSSGAHLSTASVAHPIRTYRPSRTDGTLHVWLMQKSGGPQFRQARREV